MGKPVRTGGINGKLCPYCLQKFYFEKNFVEHVKTCKKKKKNG
jgi:hypothetical protein